MRKAGGFITQIYRRVRKSDFPIVFLDRDGVIIEDVDNLVDEGQIEAYKGATSGIRLLNKSGCIVVVVTNQPVVARGWLTEDRLRVINDAVHDRFSKAGAVISAIYSCPHHPEANLEEYRVKCRCRKPGTLMFEKAASDFDVDLQSAYMVGDRTADIKAGEKLGATTILLKTGFGGSDGKCQINPDYEVDGLFSAVELIVGLDKKRARSHK